MNDRSTLLLEHHLKELKLPSFLREYDKMAAQCAAEGVDHPQYLLRLAELELIDRHQRMVQRRIRDLVLTRDVNGGGVANVQRCPHGANQVRLLATRQIGSSW